MNLSAGILASISNEKSREEELKDKEAALFI